VRASRFRNLNGVGGVVLGTVLRYLFVQISEQIMFKKVFSSYEAYRCCLERCGKVKWIYIALLVIYIGMALGLVIANEPNTLKLFDIGINVYVPEKDIIEVIEVKLDIRNASGSVSYPNIAKLYLDRDTRIRFMLLSAEVEGDVMVALNGRAILVGVNGDKYAVSMPCLYANIECFRVSMLIPGYDTPMPLPGGIYSVSLELSWYGASGVGMIRLKLGIVKESDIIITNTAMIEPILQTKLYIE